MLFPTRGSAKRSLRLDDTGAPLTGLHAIAVALAGLAFGAALASPFVVFVRREQPSRWLPVAAVSAVCSIGADFTALARAGDISQVYVLIGIALFVASLGLFAAAAYLSRAHRLSYWFSPDVPVYLHQNGPYRWIRHPFYTSYLLSYAGVVFASANGWTLIPLIWMAILYGWAAAEEERKFGRSALATEYAAYCLRTGRFFPGGS